jgi:hypothetical protein
MSKFTYNENDAGKRKNGLLEVSNTVDNFAFFLAVA